MTSRSFRARVEKDGVNPFVAVPLAVSRAFADFAERGRVRVAGTVDGHPLHATLVPTRRPPSPLRERRHELAEVFAGRPAHLRARV